MFNLGRKIYVFLFYSNHSTQHLVFLLSFCWFFEKFNKFDTLASFQISFISSLEYQYFGFEMKISKVSSTRYITAVNLQFLILDVIYLTYNSVFRSVSSCFIWKLNCKILKAYRYSFFVYFYFSSWLVQNTETIYCFLFVKILMYIVN